MVFLGLLEKPPWGMVIEICMSSFIEIVRLEKCQKSGELWLGGDRMKGILSPICLKFKVP